MGPRSCFGIICGHPLKATFLKMFSIACCKEVLVADHMQFFKCNLQWNISFPNQSKIRRWTQSLSSLISCILSS
jgi:hypothetical protein